MSASSSRCTERGRAKKDRPRWRRSSIAATTVTAVDTVVPRHSRPQRVFHRSLRRRLRAVDSTSLFFCVSFFWSLWSLVVRMYVYECTGRLAAVVV